MLTVGFITIYDSYVSLGHLYMALEYAVIKNKKNITKIIEIIQIFFTIFK